MHVAPTPEVNSQSRPMTTLPSRGNGKLEESDLKFRPWGGNNLLDAKTEKELK